MAIFSADEAIEYVRENQNVPAHIATARKYTDTLKAVFAGKNYLEQLKKIEHLESDSKIKARKNYSFSTKAVTERTFRPIDNIWTATGGTKLYALEKDAEKEELANWISNFRGGKSIEQYNEYFWIKLYQTDPAGVINLEYDADKNIKPFPVSYSIHKIRNYIPNGINVEVLLFESEEVETGTGQRYKEWRLIDDQTDYRIIQEGDSFRIDEDKTFEHPFGQVPALINSDIEDVDTLARLSPADDVLELMQEYLRDQSIRTIFKFLQGIPLFWRYVTHCKECAGTGRDGESNVCQHCDGHGIVGRRDITDSIDLEVPDVGQNVIAPNIAGWIVPPIEIWNKYDLSLEELEKVAKFTHWGSIIDTEKANTATEKMINAQAIIQRLHKYSQQAEIREKKFTELGANYLFPLKPKQEQICSISLGRNYAIIPARTILQTYETAKKEGDNTVILANLFNEYLLSKYKSDPVALSMAQLKAQIEPYLHYNIDQITKEFGNKEAQKKMLFDDWWVDAITQSKTTEALRKEFNDWFETQINPVQPIEPAEPTNSNQNQ